MVGILTAIGEAHYYIFVAIFFYRSRELGSYLRRQQEKHDKHSCSRKGLQAPGSHRDIIKFLC
jgi:hypothetical protein